jgi:subtilisin family serine protease
VSGIKSNNPKRIKSITVQNKPGHIYNTISIGDSIQIIDWDLTELADVIIEFKEEPMFILQKMNGLKKISGALYQARQTQFSNDLSQIYKRATKAYSTALNQPQKKREYFKAFNGINIIIPKAMLSSIASLPYVKKIHKNNTVSAYLDKSVKIIGADSVWFKYNDQGDSVVVGVIDSGIDYIHPALGGGFGKGYKVIGGYDFVNKDNDPMDDYGHGTHVAGIIAGNSNNIKGVAPKALLVAYKVLESHGIGLESDIIAAIEMAADPNDDGNCNDRLDIVNMSLGSNIGNPFDAMTGAVNNAVKLGVTFCIAAGNDRYYDKIGSPGTAELAITVGATDKADTLAEFSSKGPTKKTYIIKPEILAPGVNIKSSLPDSKYENNSGTSMATPHVSGVCALIKHLHKDWTPEMIKSAIVSSAKDLGLDIMALGAGRVNAIKAISLKTVTIPSQLNFGLDKHNSENWETADTITIHNNSKSPQYYNIKVRGLSNGIMLVANQNNFTLQPGEMRYIVFNLNVDNQIVNYKENGPYSYGGVVQINGTEDTLKVPWAFVKAPVLSLSFGRPLLFYQVFNKDRILNSYFDAWKSNDLYSSELLLPSGNYSILSYFTNPLSDSTSKTTEVALIYKDSINIQGYKELKISSDEAIYKVNFNGLDESGRKLSNLSNSKCIIDLFSRENDNINRYLSGITSDNELKLKASYIPSSISIISGQFQNDPYIEHKVRIANFPIFSGLNSNIELKNSPTNFLQQNIRIHIPLGIKDSYSQFPLTFRFKVSNWVSYLYGTYFRGDEIKEKNWEGVLYLTPELNQDFGYSTEVFSFSFTDFSEWIETEEFRTKGDNIMCFNFFAPSDMFSSTNNETMVFGDGPIYPSWPGLSNSAINVNSSGYSITSLPFFYGQLKESRYSDLNHSVYTIYDQFNNIEKHDTLSNYRNTPITLPLGKHKFELKNNHYTVAGRWGKATLLTDINKTDSSYNSPNITTLRVLSSSGMPVNILPAKDKGRISFSVQNSSYTFIDTAETKLYLKINGTQSWKEISISKRINDDYLGVVNTAEIGAYADLDSALIDIKVVTQNKTSNRTEWTLEPGFAVGNYTYNSESTIDTLNFIPVEYKLYNNYPNPFNPVTTITYLIPKKTFVELEIFDILGRKISTLVNKEQSAGKYSVLFNAGSLSSGIYICTIRAGQFRSSKKLLLLK